MERRRRGSARGENAVEVEGRRYIKYCIVRLIDLYNSNCILELCISPLVEVHQSVQRGVVQRLSSKQPAHSRYCELRIDTR